MGKKDNTSKSPAKSVNQFISQASKKKQSAAKSNKKQAPVVDSVPTPVVDVPVVVTPAKSPAKKDRSASKSKNQSKTKKIAKTPKSQKKLESNKKSAVKGSAKKTPAKKS